VAPTKLSYIHGSGGTSLHFIGFDGLDREEEKSRQTMRKLKFY